MIVRDSWFKLLKKWTERKDFGKKIFKQTNKKILKSFLNSISLKQTIIITKWLLNCLVLLSQGNNCFPITPFCDSARFIRISSAPSYAPIQPEQTASSSATTALSIKRFKVRISFRFHRSRRQIPRQSSGIGRSLKTPSSLAGSESCLCDPRLTPSTRNALTSTSKSWG